MVKARAEITRLALTAKSLEYLNYAFIYADYFHLFDQLGLRYYISLCIIFFQTMLLGLSPDFFRNILSCLYKASQLQGMAIVPSDLWLVGFCRGRGVSSATPLIRHGQRPLTYRHGQRPLTFKP